MKRINILFVTTLFAVCAFSQVPEKMSYQAVIRNAKGELVKSRPVGVKISILQGSATGTPIYIETHVPATNENGLATFEIGGGTPILGIFAGIDWSTGIFFLKTETDPTGGTKYTITGTSQIMSVAYALYAKTSGNGFSGNYNDLTNLPTLFDGGWTSLTGKPTTLTGYGITDAFNGTWVGLTGKPTFSTVATSGNYNDLSNKPTLFDGNYSSLSNRPNLSLYATKDMANKNITNLANPIANQDAATKAYVDELRTLVETLKERIIVLEDGTEDPDNWEGKVMTVHGLIPADLMGITLPHEHLLIQHKGPGVDLVDEATAISELQYYADAGGKTLTEVTNMGIGRDPEGLKRISTATGINVIMGSGFYKDGWVNDIYKDQSVEQLTNIIISDIKTGINGIHAGVIGEIGISRPMTQFEEKVVIAAARAQKATGAAIILHFDISDDVNEKHYVLDMLENEGADLTRVSISHNTPYVDQVDDFITYAQRGSYVAFDMFGLEVRIDFQPELEPVETIKALIDQGYLEHILISQDVCFTVCYVQNGGYGYGNILNNVVPKLKAGGVTDAQINTIMVENPKRILPFKTYTQ